MERVPPELMREIFIHATRIPGFLEVKSARFEPVLLKQGITVPLYNYGDEWPYLHFSQVANESIQNKLSIIQVSKSWNLTARELLFELVFITKYSQLEGFIDAIQRSYSDDKTFGWFVRQLVVAPHHLWLPHATGQPVLLPDILDYCPRLELISNGAATNFLLHSLTQSRNTSLRHLEWFGVGPTIEIFPWSDIFQRLEVLLLVTASFEILPFETATPLSFPQLHTIIVQVPMFGELLPVMGKWVLPKLRNVTLTGKYFQQSIPFYDAHGANITTLEIERDLGLAHILSACSSLESLIIASPSWGEAIPFMSKLTKLGIAETYFVGNLQVQPALELLLSQLNAFCTQKRCPSLELVRLFGTVNGKFNTGPEFARALRMWRALEADLGKEGIRIEDETGDVLRFPNDTIEMGT